MRLLYGTPPSPGRGRDLEKALKELEKNRPKPVPRPKGHTFEWHGLKFTWEAGARFDAACEDWSASVWPDGLRWKAHLMLCGGSRDGLGDTPQEALDEAVRLWVQATGKLLPRGDK